MCMQKIHSAKKERLCTSLCNPYILCVQGWEELTILYYFVWLVSFIVWYAKVAQEMGGLH